MPPPSLHLAACAAAALLALPAGDRRHGPDSTDAGLPMAEAPWAPYDPDPEHVTNRVFRALYLVELVPDDVGEALLVDATDGALAEDWMLRWRDGDEGDRRLFGGDGRQLPREGFTADEEEALAVHLGALDGDALAGLRARPALAVLFQHDLLRMVMRLQATGENPALLGPLVRAARAVALPRAALEGVGDSLAAEGAAPAGSRAAAWYAERGGGPWVEVERRSTRLFDPARTLLWTRVWLAHPGGRGATLALLEAATADGDLEVPVGTRGLLVQGIVALDDHGAAVATDLVIDARAQVLAHRDGRRADDPTTSRDGVDFEVLHLEREGLRRAGERPPFRVVRDDDQDLFRDYGTLKHTTYRAQCALCHRTTRTPEPGLGGFPVLRAHARPRPAEGAERVRAAESAVGRWLESLGA